MFLSICFAFSILWWVLEFCDRKPKMSHDFSPMLRIVWSSLARVTSRWRWLRRSWITASWETRSRVFIFRRVSGRSSRDQLRRNLACRCLCCFVPPPATTRIIQPTGNTEWGECKKVKVFMISMLSGAGDEAQYGVNLRYSAVFW